MGKLLRVLVVFLFILSGAALVLGIMLFEKRELLKGRTQMLEKHVQDLSEAFVEDKQAEKGETSFLAKDIEDCTATIVENPKTSNFWETYKAHLEKPDLAKMQMKTPDRRKEMMTYYLVSETETHWLTGKPTVMRDEITGIPITSGKGTMFDLLKEVTTKVGTQYGVLNETRLQLKDLREELIKTIEELNGRKKELRQRLYEIVQLKKKIAELEAEIVQLKKKIADLEEEIRALKEQIAEKDKKIKELEDQKVELQAQIEELKKEIKRLREIDPTKVQEGGAVYRFEPGPKGKVAAVNPQWNFVVLELSDEFLQELAQYKGAAPPQPELMIKRPGKEEEFITKVKLNQIKKVRKLGIADILTDWQQKPIQVGDIVSF